LRNLNASGDAERSKRRQRRREQGQDVAAGRAVETASLSLGISRCALDEDDANAARDALATPLRRRFGTGFCWNASRVIR
jgi:hypothetical protein